MNWQNFDQHEMRYEYGGKWTLVVEDANGRERWITVWECGDREVCRVKGGVA